MARQVRIEFAGAFYHVMARGDRREDIFKSDRDRELFLKTLGEAALRCGWRVHAWVLMSNHYHWVLETPEPNLVDGMKWFQNAYTRRFNVRNKLWGHVFGGRYKAVLVQQPGKERASIQYFAGLLDYVHLNPVRAGLVERNGSLLDYRWSSLAQGYGIGVGKRPDWMEVEKGLAVFNLKDQARDRRKFVERLEEIRHKERGRNCGKGQSEGQGLQSTLRRGWYWGSQEFKEALLKRLNKISPKSNRGYRYGMQAQDHDEKRAEALLSDGLRYHGLNKSKLAQLRGTHPAKAELAWVLFSRTALSQDWIAKRLEISSAANVSQVIARWKTKHHDPQLPTWAEKNLSRNDS